MMHIREREHKKLSLDSKLRLSDPEPIPQLQGKKAITIDQERSRRLLGSGKVALSQTHQRFPYFKKRKANRSVAVSKVPPIEEESLTNDQMSFKSRDQEEVEEKKPERLKSKEEQWAGETLRNFNEVTLEVGGSPLFSNQRLSRAMLHDDEDQDRVQSPSSKVPKSRGRIMKGAATARQKMTGRHSIEPPPLLELSHGSDTISPILMNKTMMISKPPQSPNEQDTLKRRKKIVHKVDKQKTVLDSQESEEFQILNSKLHKEKESRKQAEELESMKQLLQDQSIEEFQSSAAGVDQFPQFKETKPAIRGFVNVDRFFKRQPFPDLMVKELQFVPFPLDPPGRKQCIHNRQLPEEPRSHTSLNFYAKLQSPKLSFENPQPLKNGDLIHQYSGRRGSYITPQFLNDTEHVRQSRNYEEMMKKKLMLQTKLKRPRQKLRMEDHDLLKFNSFSADRASVSPRLSLFKTERNSNYPSQKEFYGGRSSLPEQQVQSSERRWEENENHKEVSANFQDSEEEYANEIEAKTLTKKMIMIKINNQRKYPYRTPQKLNIQLQKMFKTKTQLNKMQKEIIQRRKLPPLNQPLQQAVMTQKAQFMRPSRPKNEIVYAPFKKSRVRKESRDQMTEVDYTPFEEELFSPGRLGGWEQGPPSGRDHSDLQE